MANAKGKFLLFVGMLLLLGLGACKTSAGEGTTEPGLTEESQTGSNTIVAESDGLQAEATSAISVRLSWTPVEGATGYQLEGAYGEDDFLPINSVGADLTAVEIVPVPPEAEITYRLTAITASGDGSVRQVTLTTPAQTPNPTTVQVTLEQGQISIPGIDLENLDPETFDWSSFDPSVFDPATFDPESLLPEPTTVTQEIGPAGGRLEAVGLDGATYELIIPEGALPMAIDVSITPIASIDGMPDGVELVGAVQIDPAGIPLAAPATLLVTPAEPAADSAEAMLVGIGFDGSGGDFYFLPLDWPGISEISGGRSAPGLASLSQQQSGGIGTVVLHEFQSQGVVRSSPQTVVSHSQEHATADPSRATQQSLAANEAAQRSQSPNPSGPDDDLAPLVPIPNDDLAPLEVIANSDTFAYWRSTNILDRINNLPELPDQMAALDDFEILYDRWGDKLNPNRLDAMWRDLIEIIIHPLLQRSADAPCLSFYHLTGLMLGQRLGHPASAFDRELVRRYIARYGAEGQDLIKKASQIAERCPITLEVFSEITVYFTDCPVESPCHLDHFVQTHGAGLRLSWAGFDRRTGEFYLVTAGKLDYTRLEGFTGPACQWIVPGGAAQSPQLRVVRLTLQLEDSEGGTQLRDVVLEDYSTRGGQRKMIIVGMGGQPTDDCDAGGASLTGPGDLWWTAYGAIMMPYFTIDGWDVTADYNNGVIAKRYIDHNAADVSPAYTGGGVAAGCTIFRIVDQSSRPSGDGGTNSPPPLACNQ